MSNEDEVRIPVPNGDLIGRLINTERGEAVILVTASHNPAYVVIQYPNREVSLRVAAQVRRSLQLGGELD